MDVKLGKSRLPVVIEDEDGLNHDGADGTDKLG